MDMPRNRFRAALREGRHQLGLWNAIPGATAIEIAAAAGFDWVVIDLEHGPMDVPDVLPALQVVAAYPDVSAVVRPAANDAAAIKRLLDMGAQTLLVPMVSTGEEAEAAVRAMRYAPDGTRGLAGIHRASRWGRVPGYAAAAADELCLLVQVETRQGLENLEAIAGTPGVDGVFIGPSDLAASLGHLADPGHAEVQDAIAGAIARLRAAGVPSGILATDEAGARARMDAGTAFTAVGIDAMILARGLDALRAAMRDHRGD